MSLFAAGSAVGGVVQHGAWSPECNGGDVQVAAVWGKAPERLIGGLEPYPLAAHLVDTSMVAWALWDSWLSPRLRRLLADRLCGDDEVRARGWVGLAAGLHDIGKATPAFQEQAGSASPEAGLWQPLVAERLEDAGLPLCSDRAVAVLRGPSGRIARRHEYLGLVAMAPQDPEDLRQLQLDDDWLAAVVGGHHGRWHLPTFDDVAPFLAAGMCTGPWRDAQRELSAVVARGCGCDMTSRPKLDPSGAGVVVVLLTGLTILADWIASSDRVVQAGYRLIAQGADPQSPVWAQSREDELAAVVASTIGSYVPPVDARAAVFGHGSDHSPRPLQEDAEEVGGGAWFVAYPTGEGKTEAALLRHMAGEPEGLLFGLPTRATTDAMQARLASVFTGTGNTVLLSHQYAAAHHVECASEYGLEWYSSSIRRLVAPVVAATCDQVLVGALRQHHAALRLLALANHHVVLDEVHTYDHYQSHLLKSLLSWWSATGTRVTFLSATMPLWQRREFAAAYRRGQPTPAPDTAYPAHWQVHREVAPVRCPPLSMARPDLVADLTSSDDATTSHVSWACAVHQRDPLCRVAVIRSTVNDTVDTARRLSAVLQGPPVVCIHSRMTVAHRRRVEAALLQALGPGARGGPVVVVASQVLEASLDIDFDLMSTDLAPAACLVQRAGRLWRSVDDTGRRQRFGATPAGRELHVVARTRGGEITGRVSLPYFDSELSRVAQWLSHTPRLRIPQDVQGFVDDTSVDLAAAQADSAAAQEIAAASRRIEAAARCESGLSARVADVRARCRYPDLVVIAGGDGDEFSLVNEDRMGTRFDDQVSATYLLVGGGPGVAAPLPVLRTTHDGALLRQALGCMVPVSGAHLCGLLDDAAARTVASGWKPASRLLTFARPVETRLLADYGLLYDERFGLVDAQTLRQGESQ